MDFRSGTLLRGCNGAVRDRQASIQLLHRHALGMWSLRERIWPSFAPAYLVIGLLFNPLAPFHFHRSTWQALDVVSGVTLLASVLATFIARGQGGSER
jgi:hypothetical protein